MVLLNPRARIYPIIYFGDRDMKKLILGVSLIIATGSSFAADDAKIIEAVEKSVKTKFFPADVKVKSVDDMRFFPTDDDTAYARFGNVCGTATVSKDGLSKKLTFITTIEEKSSQLSIETPSIYDLDNQADIAREDLKKRCK